MKAKEISNQSTLTDQDELIGLVYEAVLEPALWPQLLEQMNLYLNAIPEPFESGSDESISQQKNDHDALKSHFKRAAKIQQKVSQLESIADALSHVLNRLPIGVMLVRRDASVIVSNQLATDIVETGKHLSIQHGQLLASSSVRTRQLHGLIRDSFMTNSSISEQDEKSMLNIGTSEQETLVWVTTSASLHSSMEHGEKLAAVFMHSAKMQREVPLTLFITKFHLSKGESRLIKVMLNGCHTLNEAAEHLSVSKHTARSQIKSIFSKTGCNSQNELIKRILISPAAMISDQNKDVVINHKNIRGHQYNNEYLSMHLHDGRRLVWKEFGLPDGKPVMVFHSLTGAHPDYHAASEKGLRLIVPERPGAHGSDPLHGRNILDWADDVQQLADHLEFETFSLIGYSAGSPYALACIDKIPHRVRNISLVSAMAPVRSEDDLIGMIPLNYTAMRLGHKSPDLMVDFMKVFLKELEQNPDSYFTNVADHQPDTDRAVLLEEKTKAQFMLAFQSAAKENFQQMCDEITLCASDWPIDLSRFQGQISIWHGLDDPLVPVAMSKRIAAMAVDPKLYFIEGSGNYLTYSHWDKILLELEA